MRMGLMILPLLGALAFTSCATAQAAVLQDEATPPSAKQAIQWLLESQAIPLSVHPSCNGVGTEFGDGTLGAYLSGMLAELADGGRNAIRSSCRDDPNSRGRWSCQVLIQRAAGEEEWSWGVEFAVPRRGGKLIPSSIRCIGAG